MKISASYWMFEGGLEGKKPLSEAIQEAKELGFDAIELCIAGSGVLTDKTTKSECLKIVELAKKTGIEISGVASGENWTISPTSNDSSVRKRSIEFTRKSLEITNWLGTDAFLYIPGAVDVFFLPDAVVIPYEICYERAQEAISELLPSAEATGVTLCIENVWNKFLLSPLEMKDFIDSFNSPYIGSYFVVVNVLLTGYPDQWIKILGKRIKRLHIKDFKSSVGTVDGFVDLLEGNVNFPEVVKALKGIGYSGYLTSEIIPFSEGRPEKTAFAMKKLFKQEVII